MKGTSIPANLRQAFAREAHPFLMWEGIQLVPESIQEVLGGEMQAQLGRSAELLDDKERIHLVGCGTSFFSAIGATYAYHALGQRLAIAHQAFEFSAYPPPLGEKDVLIAISHSGSSHTVLDSARLARNRGLPVVAFVDAPDSELARIANISVGSRMGVEPALPKTRSFVSILARLYFLAIASAQREGQALSVERQRASELPLECSELIAAAEPQAKQLAKAFGHARRIIVIGAGPQYAAALEGALKLCETALLSTDAWELEETGHGTWAGVQPDDVAIVMVSKGKTVEKATAVLEAMKEVGVRTWAIAEEGLLLGADDVTHYKEGLPEWMSPMVSVLPLYLLSYFLALQRGLNPDIMGLDDERRMRARQRMRG